MYKIVKLLGEGAYAKVYCAFPADPDNENFDDDLDAELMVIKVQQPSCPWEFYITTELQDRLKHLQPINSVVSHIK